MMEAGSDDCRKEGTKEGRKATTKMMMMMIMKITIMMLDREGISKQA
jgi:hypothetical protein